MKILEENRNSMAHDHNHDHEERTLVIHVVDEQNETLFEIFDIDGEIWKEHVPLILQMQKRMKTAVEIQAYSFYRKPRRNRASSARRLRCRRRDPWSKKSSSSFMEVKHQCVTPTQESRKLVSPRGRFSPTPWYESWAGSETVTSALETRRVEHPVDVFSLL